MSQRITESVLLTFPTIKDKCSFQYLTRDVSGDVLQRDWILHGELVRLALDPALVDENPGVGRETREGHHDVVVQHADLLHGALLLQFGHRLLLHAEDDDAAAADAHGGRPLLHGLLGVLNLRDTQVGLVQCFNEIPLALSYLEEVSIGGEDGDGSVVSGGHGDGAMDDCFENKKGNKVDRLEVFKIFSCFSQPANTKFQGCYKTRSIKITCNIFMR